MDANMRPYTVHWQNLPLVLRFTLHVSRFTFHPGYLYSLPELIRVGLKPNRFSVNDSITGSGISPDIINRVGC